MNATVLNQDGVDYAQGVKRFMGRAQLYEKALSRFPRDTCFARAQEAYQAQDRAQLYAHAHELKGVCGNIALTHLYAAACALVELLRDEDCDQTALDTAWAALEQAYHRAILAIQTAMEESK